MKIILALTLFSSIASAGNFFGPGSCFIESHPCKDGRTVSCSAQGPYGGFCAIDKTRKHYIVTCLANGGFQVTRSCLRK